MVQRTGKSIPDFGFTPTGAVEEMKVLRSINNNIYDLVSAIDDLISELKRQK